MNNKDRKIGTILGVSICSAQKSRLLSQVQFNIRSGKKTLVVTPNPEILLAAKNDITLLNILNKADISIVDGVGVAAWFKFLTLPNPKDPIKRFLTLFVQGLGVEFSILFNRKWLFTGVKPIKGREFAMELTDMCHKNGYKVFLLGGESGESGHAKIRLSKIFPGIKIDSFQGPNLDDNGNPRTKKDEKLNSEAIKKINKISPDLLFVGMTCPRQEKWLYRYLPEINARVGMTVGGTFKYLSGERVIPPAWVSDLGLEWLWRLATGSQNIERIGKAVWEFPINVFWEKLRS